jgi:hypothetical protein
MNAAENSLALRAAHQATLRAPSKRFPVATAKFDIVWVMITSTDRIVKFS